MWRRDAIPEARAVSFRLRPIFVVVFGAAGFVYCLFDPFLALSWPEALLRVASALVGFFVGAAVGWLLCYLLPLRTP